MAVVQLRLLLLIETAQPATKAASNMRLKRLDTVPTVGRLYERRRHVLTVAGRRVRVREQTGLAHQRRDCRHKLSGVSSSKSLGLVIHRRSPLS